MSSVQPQDKFIVRLPDGMRDRIRAAAETNGRSMNAEIVQALEKAYPRNPDIDDTAGEIVRLADALSREEDAAEQAKLKERLHDMSRVLTHELEELMGSFHASDDDDHLKYR